MPELPEVETVVNDLKARITGLKIKAVDVITKSVWRGGVPRLKLIIGASIKNIERKGKNILLHLSKRRIIVIHLGMTGKLTYENSRAPLAKHTHLIMNLNKGEIRFNDIRRFGYLDLIESASLNDVEYLARLGPDPISISKDEFVAIIRSKNRMIKPLLLDQHVISGLGNIYSDEGLHSAGIDPRRVSSRLSKRRIERLYHAIVEILNSAIEARGTSVSDYVDGSGRPGAYQNFHRVYGREGKPCPNCGRPIRREIIGGRSAHFCPRCQR